MTTQTSGAVTTYRSPSPESKFLYWGARATLRQFYRVWPMTDAAIRGLSVVEDGVTRLRDPEGVSYESGSLGGVPSVVMNPESDDDKLGNTTVLYLHGGGFIFGGPGTHRHLCSSLTLRLGVPVHAVRYRKLPEGGAGTAVEDSYAAYRALSEQQPDDHRIVVAGDSAGGFLAAKMCELASLDGIRPPDALVGYSPLLDLNGETRDGAWQTRDAYQPASTVRRAQKLWDRGPDPLRGSRSLVNLDPDIFPPTFMTAAAGELLEPDILTLTDRLETAGQTVETHRWYTAVHAFPVLDALTPESRQAGELTAAFLRRTLAPTSE